MRSDRRWSGILGDSGVVSSDRRYSGILGDSGQSVVADVAVVAAISVVRVVSNGGGEIAGLVVVIEIGLLETIVENGSSPSEAAA